MRKSPGHRKWPEHKVEEKHLGEEHRGLKDRLAFYDDKIREIHLH